MVKALSFKGDKKPRKRKREARPDNDNDAENGSLVQSSKAPRLADEDAAALDNDDSWVAADAVSDVSGPVMFVLPTEPPTALSCDANGKVFALEVENIVDGNLATAEPHDVRQVWVANKVAGTENFRFKGHHGKYLSCDKSGVFSARADAVSPLESFVLIATADVPGTFQVQTLRDTFLSAKDATTTPSKAGKAAGPEVRGDTEDISFSTTLRIRMQARFKPRIKASKEEKASQKISRMELEEAVGRKLEEDEVKKLKRARREGDYHEVLLDMKTKGKHDKYG